MKILLVVMIVGLTLPASALEERHNDAGKPHSEEADSHDDKEQRSVSSDVGPGKAVTAADPQRGIQLSPKAFQALGLRTVRISAVPALLPKESIVTTREETGVYRLREDWFRLIHGRGSPAENGIRFHPEHADDLQAGDEIVVQGAGLLRVADIASFESGGGHHH